MTAQIDQFSLVTVPLSLYFNEAHLSNATGFIWQEGRQNYLITNWRVTTGRNSLTGKPLQSHGGRPNKIHALFNTRVQQFLKQEHFINIRDADDKRQQPFGLSSSVYTGRVVMTLGRLSYTIVIQTTSKKPVVRPVANLRRKRKLSWQSTASASPGRSTGYCDRGLSLKLTYTARPG
jgi:hypothetical protein